MSSTQQRNTRRQRRKIGIRKRIFGTPERPRLTVYRSLKHIYAQIVDDVSGKTLAAVSSVELHQPGGNVAAAKEIGKKLSEKAKDAGVTAIAFDRNGFRYHGRVKALADALREGGLSF